MRTWIAEHDRSWLFVGLYVGLAVVLSIWISLFWLAAIAGAHLVLEVLRHRIHGYRGAATVSHALWEVKLDLALVCLALALALHMDVVLGVLGLQSAARATAATRFGLRVVPRAVSWERLINGVLLTVDDLFMVARGVLMGRSAVGAEAAVGSGGGDEVGTAVAAPAAPLPESPATRPWRDPWGWGDRLSLALGVASVAAILLAPVLTVHDLPSAVAALAEQLHPWPR